MKTLLFLLISLLCLGSGLKAQDQLFRKDNTRLQVKIIEIGPEEIKYKLTANPDGPVYSEGRANVILIIFANGQHELITPGTPPAAAATSTVITTTSIIDVIDPPISRADSLKYYSYHNNISINFLHFFNNEIGIMYQREFFKKQFNMILPLSIGLEKPEVTQSTYFTSIASTGTGSGFILDRKLAEAGIGIHYYPSLRSSVNYFIGPVFRYMRYEGSHYANFYDKANKYNYTVFQGSKLSRYCFSITNGFVVRTRSRLTISGFASIGFKKDVASNPILDPYSGEKENTYNPDFSLYFWSGFNIGFSF